MLSNSLWQQPSTMTLRCEVISLAAASSRCPIRVQLVCSCLFKPQSRRQRVMRSRPLLGYALASLYVCFASIPLRYKLKTCTKPTLVRENASSLLFFSRAAAPGSFIAVSRCCCTHLDITSSPHHRAVARSRCFHCGDEQSFGHTTSLRAVARNDASTAAHHCCMQ